MNSVVWHDFSVDSRLCVEIFIVFGFYGVYYWLPTVDEEEKRIKECRTFTVKGLDLQKYARGTQGEMWWDFF